MYLKKYWILTRAGILESLRFRISTLTIILGNIIYMLISYYLWKSIFDSVETNEVNGLTFYETLIYIVLARTLFSFMELYLVWQMGDKIKTGKISLDIIKPISCYNYLFWSQSGELIVSFFTTLLPTFLIVFFLTDGTISIGLNILFFCLSVVFSVVINFNIDFIVGTIGFYTQSIWGINIAKEVTVLLLSGATIPVAFMPDMMKKIVFLLPFQSIYNTPLSLLIDNDMQLKNELLLILLQFFWLVIIIVIRNIFWNKTLKVISINGG